LAHQNAALRAYLVFVLFSSTTKRPAGPNLAEGGPLAVLGRYELLEELGRGAMGRVFKARDPKINRVVAIKSIDLAAEFEASEIEDARQGFFREAEAAGRLNHPNIVTVFDVGEAEGLAYMAMEYVTGRRLSDHADSHALLPVPLVLELLARAAEALDYAHARNVVHRDIKPANIMYDAASDGLKITDFGVARLMDVNRTRVGLVLGTPSFMSPEQLEGENVKGHTDLFALGVSLYQLLTGRLPFRGASMPELMFVIAYEPHHPVTAVRPALPAALDRVLDAALAKNPAQRFASGTEMAAALRDAARGIAA
jgi:eukaryotic-like serine/threonine-protein kinase